MSPKTSPLIAVVLALALGAGPALALPGEPATPVPETGATAPPLPPPTTPVEVTTLAAPDAFSVAGRDTGLPADLWKNTPPGLMRTVLPLLATRPLTPAAAALARRVLATGAPGPRDDDGDDLTGARANALLALGDVAAASVILQRAPGVERSSSLSQAAAESALLTGDEARACAVAQALSVGRDDIYWLRLRTYCQALAGQTAAAQLTLELAQAHTRDNTFGRLMAAKLGSGAAGAPSLRNGLDLALSRSLGLDLTTAKASPAVAATLSPPSLSPPAFDPTSISPDKSLQVMAMLFMSDGPIGGETMGQLLSGMLEPAALADPKAAARTQGAILLMNALQRYPGLSSVIFTFAVPEGKAPIGRNVALQSAADSLQQGTTALLALWTSAEAGLAGPAMGDRVRIVAALKAAGLNEDARAFALEGLASLK